MTMREGLKTKHTVTLYEREEAMLQEAYKKLSAGRRLNTFIKTLIVIGLERCADVTTPIDFDRLLVSSKKRNDLRAEGKQIQKKATDLMESLQASLHTLINTMPDNVTPHYETKIIQFPQRYVFSGSA